MMQTDLSRRLAVASNVQLLPVEASAVGVCWALCMPQGLPDLLRATASFLDSSSKHVRMAHAKTAVSSSSTCVMSDNGMVAGSAQPPGTLHQLQDGHKHIRTRAMLQLAAGSSNSSSLSAGQVCYKAQRPSCATLESAQVKPACAEVVVSTPL
jgi:hypothetical protein